MCTYLITAGGGKGNCSTTRLFKSIFGKGNGMYMRARGLHPNDYDEVKEMVKAVQGS